MMSQQIGDLISRRAVLDLIKNKYGMFSHPDVISKFIKLEEEINDISPVNPQEPKTIQEKQAESEKYDKAFDDGYENGYAQARFDYGQEPCTNIPFLLHKELGCPLDECVKAYDVAIEYLRSQAKIRG